MTNAKAARKAKFEAVFDVVRDELLEDCKKQGLPHDALEWYRQNLDYNVRGGKLNRGLSVIDSVEILKGRALTEEEYFKAAVLGWCMELLQAYFLVSDDMMDSSLTRRGQPCWYLSPSPVVVANKDVTSQSSYKHPVVGNTAINDSFMLEGAVFELLRKHFRRDPCYIDLVELFRDVIRKTVLGQMGDLITAPEGVVDFGRFSLERHSWIVIYKTAYYSFQLPVAAAMYMCNIPESYNVQTAEGTKTIRPYDLALSILIPTGEYFQIQDDFLDFSAPPEILGKIGTDIVDNKCSWCINTALKLCTPEQRLILEKNYGRKGDIETGAEGSEDDQRADGQEQAGGLCEKRVKEVYEAVGLRKVYAEYEERVYKEINQLIESIPEDGVIVDEKGEKVESHSGLKKQVFKHFLEKIYGRSK